MPLEIEVQVQDTSLEDAPEARLSSEFPLPVDEFEGDLGPEFNVKKL